MKLALIQLNGVVGDLAGNAERLLRAAERAARRGAELLVCPELALPGYPPLDLLDEPAFVERVERANSDVVTRLGRTCPDCSVIFGTIDSNPEPRGKRLRNVAVLARSGQTVAVRAKTLLPTYGVFDEARWFEPASENAVVEHLGSTLGLTTCEDAWNDEVYWERPLYQRDPIAELSAAGADLLVNLSASPFHRGGAGAREEMLRHGAARNRRPLVFVNQVGANDELIFDGGSAVFGADGRVLVRAARFAEDIAICDLDGATATAGEMTPPPASAAELRSALVMGLADYFAKCDLPGALVGLSGGIDSAVVAALAVDALGAERVEGVLMPSRFSSRGSVDDALDLGQRLGITTRTIPIEAAHAATLEMLASDLAGSAPGLTEENIQARIRGTILMALSNELGRVVLATGNKSELAVGYCTLYGDLIGGISVLGDCYKGCVRELAVEINGEREIIPTAILDKPPSAELRPDQKDTDSLPPYSVLDPILEGLIERRLTAAELTAEGHDPELIVRVRGLLDRSEHKRRQAPPILRVTRRAFGTGRRLPVARKGYW